MLECCLRGNYNSLGETLILNCSTNLFKFDLISFVRVFHDMIHYSRLSYDTFMNLCLATRSRLSVYVMGSILVHSLLFFAFFLILEPLIPLKRRRRRSHGYLPFLHNIRDILRTVIF